VSEKVAERMSRQSSVSAFYLGSDHAVEQYGFRPAWAEVGETPEIPDDTRCENAIDRIQRTGPGGELLRRIHLEHLRLHMEILYEHGSLADVLGFLCGISGRLTNALPCRPVTIHKNKLNPAESIAQ